jgi:hypothetical protein
LEKAWDVIEELHPEVPDAIFRLTSGWKGKTKKQGVKHAHWHAATWTAESADKIVGEVAVSGEGLGRPATAVTATLVHEAAHALAHARGIKDTSRQGRYHNEEYRKLAEELGLVVNKDKTKGWTVTVLTPESAEKYKRVTEIIAQMQEDTQLRYLTPDERYMAWVETQAGLLKGEALQKFLEEIAAAIDAEAELLENPKIKKTIECKCADVRIIRVSKSEFDRGKITCELCKQPFEQIERAVDLEDS